MIKMAAPMRLCGRVGLVCSAALLVFALDAAAAQAQPAPATSFGSVLQVLFGLGVVLAAIAATAWMLKRLGPGQTSPASNLRVVGGVAVGPKERVVLVDVGDTRLVLGVAPGRVSTLHQMPRPQHDPAEVVPDPLAGLFQDKLRAMLNKKRDGDVA